MAAIAGILTENKPLVERMLAKMRHRGPEWSDVLVTPSLTLGLAGSKIEQSSRQRLQREQIAQDGSLPGRFARVHVSKNAVLLERDPLSAAPLYYGYTSTGILCFASEVKGLLEATTDVHELPPGHTFDTQRLQPYFSLTLQPPARRPRKSLPANYAQNWKKSSRGQSVREKTWEPGSPAAWIQARFAR